MKYKITKASKMPDIGISLIVFMLIIVLIAVVIAVSDYIIRPDFYRIPASRDIFKPVPEQTSAAWWEKKKLARKMMCLGLDAQKAIEIAAPIIDYSEKYDLSPDLITAIIMTESGFNPELKSATDDHGLAQINRYWWLKELSAQGIADMSNIYTIEHNINACCYVLVKINSDLSRYNTNPAYPGKVLKNMAILETI